MKLTFILVMAACLQAAGSAFAQKVTISQKQATLSTVFGEIQRQTGYVFFYDEDLLKKARPVTLQLKDVSLKEALEICFRDQPLTYSIVGNTVAVKLLKNRPVQPVNKETPLVSDTAAISDKQAIGVVTDENNNRVSGVSVIVKSSGKGFVTNERGEFVCREVKDKDTLEFRSVDLLPVKIPVNTKERMFVVMHPNVRDLQSVVVYNTGYQKLLKERATGAFAKPDMNTFRDRTSTLDVLGRLEGLVPGLTLTLKRTGNKDGSTNLSPVGVVRGISTVTLPNTNPLFVLNGVIVSDFNGVNPDDIADITVLKDAAAAAIWGVQAANGVLVVTTKDGRKNQRLTINYSGNINFQGKPNFDARPVLSSRQFIDAAKETFDPVTYNWKALYQSAIAPHDQILYDQYRGVISADEANRRLDSLGAINNMGQIKDLWYRDAFTTNHTVSASGGNEMYSFFASLGYTGRQGNRPGEKANTYRLNVTQGINIGRRIKINLNTSLINNITDQQNPIQITNTFLPYQLFRDAAGNNINMPYMLGVSDSLRLDYQNRSRINMDYVPLNELNYKHSRSNNLSVNVTSNVDVKLWKGLSFQGTYGYQKQPGTYTSYEDNKSLRKRKELLSFTVAPTVNSQPVYYLPMTGGDFNQSNTDQRNWTVRNQLIYNTVLRQGRDMLLLQVGQEAQESSNSTTSTKLFGYNEAMGTNALMDYATLNKGISGTVPGGFAALYDGPQLHYETLSRASSYFALANYTFNGKYSLDLSWRRDHSNLFGSDVSTQNKPVWSVGGRWRLSRENFMASANVVNDLSIRATYGVTGNSPNVGSASRYDIIYIIGQSTSGVISGDGYKIGQPANRKLAWEATHTLNIGVDFALLNNRISGTIDVYRKMTKDLLGSIPTNQLTGYFGINGNIGSLSNRGIDVSLQTRNLRLKDFSWTTNFVFSFNKNKLESYVVVNPLYDNAAYKTVIQYYVGYSLYPLFAYNFAGLDNMGDPQIRLSDKSITKTPGVARPDDVKYMGSIQPVFNGGLSNTFTYKGLSLSVNMVYSMGHKMRNEINNFTTGRLTGDLRAFSYTEVRPEFMDRWRKPGDEAFTNVPSFVASRQESNARRGDLSYYKYADINVLDASYVKIRDLTLSYAFLPQLTQRLGIQSFSIFMQATNFMVWKANHKGIDPEFFDRYNGRSDIPPYKHSYSMGVNVTF